MNINRPGYRFKKHPQRYAGAWVTALVIIVLLGLTEHFTAQRVFAQPEPVLGEAEDVKPMDGDQIDGERERGGDRQEFRRKMHRRHMMDQRGEGKGEGSMGPGKGGYGKEGRARRLGNFINFMNNLNDSLKDPYQATGLAIMGVKDAYRKDGKPLDAVPVLEEYLEKTKDQSLRNLLLFNIRQIYEEADKSDKVLELSKQILKENFGAVANK